MRHLTTNAQDHGGKDQASSYDTEAEPQERTMHKEIKEPGAVNAEHQRTPVTRGAFNTPSRKARAH